MTFKPSSIHKFFFTYICPRFYGGSPPSAPSNTTSTVTQNSIPAELMPYATGMLSAASNQLYTKDASGNITGYQPYKPYSTNAQDYVAPFSSMQQQAQTSAAGLQTPGQFAPATQLAGASGIGQLGTAQTAQNYGAQGANLGMGSALSSANQAGQQQAQAGMYGAQGMNVGMGSALSSANQAGQQQAQAGMYGAQGAGYGQNAANVGAMGGLGYGAQSANLGMTAAGTAGQGYGAGAQYAQQATDPNSVSAYMSPYIQNVMQQQGRELNRNYDISGVVQQGQATQAGAFGGSREALMAAENERNRNMALNKMQAEGLQSAYTAANQNQQFGANLNLQGMQAGNQAMQTGLQGIGQGITGVNTALQGYQQGVSGAQAGLQGVQAQTNASQMGQAGTAQALQGVGYGLQGVGAQTAASQMEQAGVAQGISGAQAGLAGVQGAQQGYTGATNTAATLGNLGSAQLAAQQGVIGTQSTMGGQQQAQNQAAIDQAVLNYQNEQQQPYLAAGTMSSLIRGTSTGNLTTQNYQAQPSALTQIGGALGTAGSLYGAATAKAKGGIIQAYAGGGSVEGNIESQLQDMDDNQLQQIMNSSPSESIKGIAKRILAEHAVEGRAKGGIIGYSGEYESYVRPEANYPESSSPIEEYTKHGIKSLAEKRVEEAKRAYAAQSKNKPMNAGQARAAQIEALKGSEAYAPKEGIAGPTVRGARIGPQSFEEGSSQFTGEGIKKVGRVGSKGLGLAGAGLYAAETFSEPSVLDTFLANRAKAGDPQAQQVMASGGTNPIMESLKQPVREQLNKLDPSAAWDYIKNKFTQPAQVTVDNTLPTSILEKQLPNSSATPQSPTANAQELPVQKQNVADQGINSAALANRSINNAFDNAGLTGNVESNAVPEPQQGVPVQSGGIANLQAVYDAYDKEDAATAAKSEQDIMAEETAKRKAAGIDTSQEASAAERKQIMDERANAGVEQKRQMYLRMGEFFANWGSTPGAPLAAGLKAMKETLPGVMDDSKAHIKLMRDINKSENDLNHAVRLEQMGLFDKASLIKEKASDRILQHKEAVAGLAIKEQIRQESFAQQKELEAMQQGGANYRSELVGDRTNNVDKRINELSDNITNSIAELTKRLTPGSGYTIPEKEAAKKEIARLQGRFTEINNLVPSQAYPGFTSQEETLYKSIYGAK